MNRYGIQAKAHWQTHLPRRYKALDNPDQFFQQLGEEIQDRVLSLEEDLRQSPGPDFLANLGQLGRARQEAEEMAMRELALLPPEGPDSNN